MTTQWFNMLHYACVYTSRQSATLQCTNVDPVAIIQLEIPRNNNQTKKKNCFVNMLTIS